MEITEQELDTLNFYRVSELYGGLLLGQMVGRAREPALVVELTRHSAEEVMHAQLWAETIVAVGGRPRPSRDTYQRRLASLIGRPSSLLEVLAATQVFERRVYRHFIDHLNRKDTHPRVQATLARMIEEEKHHLSWVKDWLDQQASGRADRVTALIRRYRGADAAVYRSLLMEHGWAMAA